MRNNADVTLSEGEFILTGDLDFSNVVSIYEKALAQFNAANTLVFNFSQLKTSNSAGLALIIEWLRSAKAANKSITFRHLSPQLQSIAKAAGLDSLIV